MYEFILNKKRRIIIELHKAILDVQKQSLSVGESYRQLALSYNEICRDISHSEFASTLDVLQTIFSYYVRGIKRGFDPEETPEARNFILKVCDHIKETEPFISVPDKEAGFLKSLKNALDDGNTELGNTNLNHISEEIVSKQNLLNKKDRELKKANTISIIGVVLTVVFGVMTVLQFFI